MYVCARPGRQQLDICCFLSFFFRHAQRNSLDSITPSLFACGILSRLKILDISENGLASLPETVAELKSLEDLNLEGNFLTALPDSLGELKSLRVLRLRNNQIKLISREVGIHRFFFFFVVVVIFLLLFG